MRSKALNTSKSNFFGQDQSVAHQIGPVLSFGHIIKWICRFNVFMRWVWYNGGRQSIKAYHISDGIVLLNNKGIDDIVPRHKPMSKFVFVIHRNFCSRLNTRSIIYKLLQRLGKSEVSVLQFLLCRSVSEAWFVFALSYFDSDERIVPQSASLDSKTYANTCKYPQELAKQIRQYIRLERCPDN